MDWNDALMYDARLTNAAKVFGFVMMQYANEKADDPFIVGSPPCKCNSFAVAERVE